MLTFKSDVTLARLKAGQEHQGVSDQEWLSFDPVRPSIRSSAAKIPQLTLEQPGVSGRERLSIVHLQLAFTNKPLCSPKVLL